LGGGAFGIRQYFLSLHLLPLLAVLAASCFLAAPAWSQATCIVPPGVDTNPKGSGFFASFANSKYEIPIPSGNGTNNVDFGDLNVTYFRMYYSIANLNAWMQDNNYCPVELVLVGTFPDWRYFSISQSDMHYATPQHLADAAIDPVGISGNSYSNPFTPGIPTASGVTSVGHTTRIGSCSEDC
jgi:hypothetical protein